MLREGRFARNTSAIIGWTQDDITLYTSPSIAYAEETYNSIRARYPWLSETRLDALLALYPVAEFPANTTANRTSESYRVARIWRDVLMVCQPMYVAQTLSAAGSDVYLYDWNQTVTGPALAAVRGLYGGGVLHTGEFANTFGNVSVYVVNGVPVRSCAGGLRAAAPWRAVVVDVCEHGEAADGGEGYTRGVGQRVSRLQR
ncbi:uncharacterized protein B0I36DRAFT_41560 [Microdochium trichocladiopsis]|uniref:Uncharacterized protein n=1 Tax=Microdochium trichocladiopsis TaxID=1682393 RepID=A0A9P9BIT0_9PEZI|nr:uncharacterized protein B0I36DRAFT_41560 [Microdochium trichocladiopsis]KAH7016031.1 hypothetical protein B0I36DRAFT_41560 [Microdochium trichocladiopsis]